jgi:hypothetical protein
MQHLIDAQWGEDPMVPPPRKTYVVVENRMKDATVAKLKRKNRA